MNDNTATALIVTNLLLAVACGVVIYKLNTVSNQIQPVVELATPVIEKAIPVIDKISQTFGL